MARREVLIGDRAYHIAKDREDFEDGGEKWNVLFIPFGSWESSIESSHRSARDAFQHLNGLEEKWNDQKRV